MSHLVRQRKTYYVNGNGKRVKKGAPGAKKVTEKSAKWYGAGVPGYPPKKRIPLATDKTAAQRMLDDLVRAAERGQAKLPDREAARLSLADHLTGFESDLSLGLGTKSGRKGKAPDPRQVKLTVTRVRSVLDACKFKALGDLNSAAVSKVAKHLQGLIGKKRKDGGRSAQTATFHLAALPAIPGEGFSPVVSDDFVVRFRTLQWGHPSPNLPS